MNAMLASQAGMSYGKWKALQPVVPIATKKEEIPEGWKACEYCGKQFKPRNGKRFCDGECRKAAWDRSAHKKLYMREWRARKKEGAEDGK